MEEIPQQPGLWACVLGGEQGTSALYVGSFQAVEVCGFLAIFW